MNPQRALVMVGVFSSCLVAATQYVGSWHVSPLSLDIAPDPFIASHKAAQSLVETVTVTLVPTAIPTAIPTQAPSQPVVSTPQPTATVSKIATLAPSYGPGTIQAKILSVFGSGWLGSQALCIAKAESNFRPDATGHNPNGSTDRGVFQINNFAHPNVSNAQAYDPDFNISYAHDMRLSWGSWAAWATRSKCGVN
ncbi:MAG: transglycosylase SLT domain-containing protein [Thermomicrobiales bacterium]